MKALYTERTIPIPEGCKVTLENGKFTFEGQLGKEAYDASKEGYTFEVVDKQIIIKRWHANRKKLQLINTVASHIRNYMKGVTLGYKYVLKSIFRHFPIQITIGNKGKEVTVQTFLGSKEERKYPVRGTSVAMQGETKDDIVIQGTNLLDVSQTAASISSDSFKRKKHDERIFVDGIYIFEKSTIKSTD